MFNFENNRDLYSKCRGHKSGVLWFTGLSGAGKTSLAIGLEEVLFELGVRVCVLDGDDLRHGLNGDLGFSGRDRRESIRRVTEVSATLADTGAIVITACISPFREDRDNARYRIGEGFQEVFIHADIEVCEARDPKGLYAKARSGEIENFTGISSPYEKPLKPDLMLDTGQEDVEACLTRLRDHTILSFCT